MRSISRASKPNAAIHPVYAGMETTIFEAMSGLALGDRLFCQRLARFREALT